VTSRLAVAEIERNLVPVRHHQVPCAAGAPAWEAVVGAGWSIAKIGRWDGKEGARHYFLNALPKKRSNLRVVPNDIIQPKLVKFTGISGTLRPGSGTDTARHYFLDALPKKRSHLRVIPNDIIQPKPVKFTDISGTLRPGSGTDTARHYFLDALPKKRSNLRVIPAKLFDRSRKSVQTFAQSPTKFCQRPVKSSEYLGLDESTEGVCHYLLDAKPEMQFEPSRNPKGNSSPEADKMHGRPSRDFDRQP
ncbi:hypothetical protein GGU11DRAFT_761326, partial [Lentinula aff. detonsa]